MLRPVKKAFVLTLKSDYFITTTKIKLKYNDLGHKGKRKIFFKPCRATYFYNNILILITLFRFCRGTRLYVADQAEQRIIEPFKNITINQKTFIVQKPSLLTTLHHG